ncbi:transposase family protein [Streptomyces sp. NPDC046862]|uniref:transposase family protein n=1 Tax=Streptomyces sp. NPDC046862 TaxID=3154603 RepID=UPI003454316B
MTSATRSRRWHAASIPRPARREVVQDEALATPRTRITSSWRGLTAACQALLVRERPRYGDTYAHLSAWFGMGIATVCRYVHEAVAIPDDAQGACGPRTCASVPSDRRGTSAVPAWAKAGVPRRGQQHVRPGARPGSR